jgi:hypothetical protein
MHRRRRWPDGRALLVVGLVVASGCGGQADVAGPEDGSGGDGQASDDGAGPRDAGGSDATVEVGPGGGTDASSDGDAADGDAADGDAADGAAREGGHDSDATTGVDAGARPDSSAGQADGGPDGGLPDGSLADARTDGPVEIDGGNARDAETDGPLGRDGGTTADAACTSPGGGSFQCGSVACNGATDYCLDTAHGATCLPLPPACLCRESLDCSCLLANTARPCDSGTPVCEAMDDGGLLWILDSFCL